MGLFDKTSHWARVCGIEGLWVGQKNAEIQVVGSDGTMYLDKVPVVSHDYGAAAADWTLNATEKRATRIIVTNANGACAAIATPTAGKIFMILNTSGQALTIKAAGQTGVTIASTKSAIVIGNGTDFVRVTADA
jgi:hypothetical protein